MGAGIEIIFLTSPIFNFDIYMFELISILSFARWTFDDTKITDVFLVFLNLASTKTIYAQLELIKTFSIGLFCH